MRRLLEFSLLSTPLGQFFAVACTLEICGPVIRVPAWHREKGNLEFCHRAQNGATCFGQGYEKKTKDFLKTVNNKGVGINKTAAGGTLTETFRLGQFLVGKSITLT